MVASSRQIVALDVMGGDDAPGPELAGLHDQILAADPALIIDPAPSPSPSPTAVDHVPRQLPADLADFAGREPELDALDLIMDARAPGSAAGATFIVVTGGAGIGKSTLAVHWAHRVAGRFPDAAAVEVTWWRESVGVEAGRLVVDRAPLTRYRLPLR